MKLRAIPFLFCLAWIAGTVHDLPAQEQKRKVVLDFGVRGGAMLAQPLAYNIDSGPRLFTPTLTFDNVYGTIGPTIGFLLYDRVDVHIEFVYKRFGYQSQSTLPPAAGQSTSSDVDGYSWEYPLLATYRFGSGKVRPFVGGGMNLGGTSTSNARFTQTTTNPPSNPPVTTTFQTKTTESLPTAYHIAWGLEWRFPVFTIRPELRYSHWTRDNSGALIVNQANQFEALVGITLHPFQAR